MILIPTFSSQNTDQKDFLGLQRLYNFKDVKNSNKQFKDPLIERNHRSHISSLQKTSVKKLMPAKQET